MIYGAAVAAALFLSPVCSNSNKTNIEYIRKYPEEIMEEQKSAQPHTLYIENRNKITVTGVTDVCNFNDEILRMETTFGVLNITGAGLQVAKLDLQTGDVIVEGNIASLAYEEKTGKNGGLFARMFS